jgi:hypothetical protein
MTYKEYIKESKFGDNSGKMNALRLLSKDDSHEGKLAKERLDGLTGNSPIHSNLNSIHNTILSHGFNHVNTDRNADHEHYNPAYEPKDEQHSYLHKNGQSIHLGHTEFKHSPTDIRVTHRNKQEDVKFSGSNGIKYHGPFTKSYEDLHSALKSHLEHYPK